MHPAVRLHRARHLAHLQRKGGRLKRRLHLAPPEAAQVAPPLCAAAVGLHLRQRLERHLPTLQAALEAAQQLQRLLPTEQRQAMRMSWPKNPVNLILGQRLGAHTSTHLERVMTVSFQLDGLRLSLCFTSTWLARTVSPLPPALSASRARLAATAAAASPPAGRFAPAAASLLHTRLCSVSDCSVLPSHAALHTHRASILTVYIQDARSQPKRRVKPSLSCSGRCLSSFSASTWVPLVEPRSMRYTLPLG